MKMKQKLIYGWGVNDVGYPVTKSKELPKECCKRRQMKVWVCPYYSKWKGILKRGFCPVYKAKYLTYKYVTICEEWKYLSNFIKWVDSQPNKDWVNCEPDKDLLIIGNKHYSPETVVFVSSKINRFILDSGKTRGDCTVGVNYKINLIKKPYKASCKCPYSGKQIHLGYFSTELEAHKAWQSKKHEYACQLADLQDDPRVADALRQRYSPDKDWSKV